MVAELKCTTTLHSWIQAWFESYSPPIHPQHYIAKMGVGNVPVACCTSLLVLGLECCKNCTCIKTHHVGFCFTAPPLKLIDIPGLDTRSSSSGDSPVCKPPHLWCIWFFATLIVIITPGISQLEIFPLCMNFHTLDPWASLSVLVPFFVLLLLLPFANWELMIFAGTYFCRQQWCITTVGNTSNLMSWCCCFSSFETR